MKALIATGTSEDKSRELARLARKSLSCFRRIVFVRPEVWQPTWACPESGASVSSCACWPGRGRETQKLTGRS